MANGAYRIFVQQGPNQGQVFYLTKEVVAIGRDISNDLVFNDPEVSRYHARLTRQAQGYALEDLGSTNGTFVNGARLAVPRVLAQGDIVSLGETVRLGFESSYDAGRDAGVGVATMADAPVRTPRTVESMPSPYQPPAGPPPETGRPRQAPPEPVYNAPPAYQQPPVQPQAPPVVAGASEQGGGRMRLVAIGLGCGTLVLCMVVVGAIVAFAPCEFWLPFYNLLGIAAGC